MTINPSGVRMRRFDPQLRHRKAKKILAVLQSILGKDLSRLKCLDIGCSVGIMSGDLAGHFGEVVGLDVDEKALAEARRQKLPNLSVVMADGTQLPFPDGAFDVVICAQVYEHAGRPAALFREIHRILTEHGTCFFSGPNKLAPVEAHYSLPFVHWLPRRLADSYLRAFGKADSYAEGPLFYWELADLASGFQVIDYTTKIIRNPSEYYCEDEVSPRWLCRIPESILRRLIVLFPNYNWVLRKKSTLRKGEARESA